MTNDLISRSKVEEVISALVHEEGITDDAAVLGCMVWNAVHTMEAVEVAPVVHGRWINQDNTYTKYQCSACKERNFDGVGRYCPNCGAKMDKEPCDDE